MYSERKKPINSFSTRIGNRRQIMGFVDGFCRHITIFLLRTLYSECSPIRHQQKISGQTCSLMTYDYFRLEQNGETSIRINAHGLSFAIKSCKRFEDEKMNARVANCYDIDFLVGCGSIMRNYHLPGHRILVWRIPHPTISESVCGEAICTAIN